MDLKRLQELAGVTVAGVQNDNVLDAVVALYLKTNTPTDAQIKAITSKANLSADQFWAIVNKLFQALLRGAGKHAHVPDEKFDKKELELGVKVEQEHTNDPYVAKIIAKDHLMEIPDYYTRLHRMEKQANG